MSEFKSKSDYNFNAAKLLMRDHQLYAPSIHCAYYSCIQYMLHIIYFKSPNKVQIDYENLVRNDNSSHKQAIKIIQLELIDKNKNDDYKRFQKTILELKKSREESDYTRTQITQGKSSHSILLAESILNLLSINFK